MKYEAYVAAYSSKEIEGVAIYYHKESYISGNYGTIFTSRNNPIDLYLEILDLYERGYEVIFKYEKQNRSIRCSSKF